MQISEQNAPEIAASPAQPRRRWAGLGVGFIALSAVLFVAFFVVPFLHLPVATKVILTTSVWGGGELSFFVGGLLLGREVVRRYRRKLNPRNWFKSAPKETGAS